MMNFKQFIPGIFLTINFIFAQNPISPPGVYFADPSAHIWHDGSLYLYGSLDESVDYYCSYRHYVMKTDDMKDWKIIKDVFFSKGADDEVTYNDDLLFAPDCAYKEGKYFLYYCQPAKIAEGVAVSNNPAGPFTNGKPLNTFGYNQIDPSVFIDDDGRAYYLWGQFSLKMAEMRNDMLGIDKSTIRDEVLTEKEHHFHEGAFLTKRNGIYYLIYTDISRAHTPTCIGYATSKNIFGPYTYRGVIIDNNHCDPGNWNNHGSIIKYKEQWYVFYHRATHGSNVMRKACVEPIFFNPDGSINEVEMTTQGAGFPLDATLKTEAERACLLYGHVRVEHNGSGNDKLSQIHNKDKAVFKYIDFKDGVKTLTLKFKKSKGSGKIELMTDQPWHKKIAEIPIGSTGNDWQELTFKVDDVKGVHALWMQFFTEGKGNFEIDWLRFNR